MKSIQQTLSVIAAVLLLTTPYSYAARVDVREITVPYGTVIPVRMIDPISSDHNHAGQIFRGSLNAPVRVHNQTVLPKGSEAYVKLVNVRSAGTLKGRSELMLQL